MSELKLYEGPAPATPPSGVVTIYPKIDGRLYWKTDDGTEVPFYNPNLSDFVRLDGTEQLTANWDAGGYIITALRFVSDVPDGTPPLAVASTTLVPNLNAQYLNGQDATFYTNVDLASQAEAEAGTDNVKTMTALRVAEAIAAQTRGYVGSNFQTGLSYTLVLEDAGKIVEMDNAADNIVYIPDNSVVAFPVNTRIDVTQRGVGSTSIEMVGTDTLTGSATVSGVNGAVSLWKRAVTEWVVYGGAT